MPTLSCATERCGGLTTVELRVRNDTTDRRRIRIENRLDGPLLTPDGTRPLRGGLTCRLAPGERCLLAYATPAPPSEPTAEITRSAVCDPGEHARSVSPATGESTRCQPRTDGGEPGHGPTTGERVPPSGAGDGLEGAPTVALPPAVEAWLARIERRVGAVEAGGPRAEPVGHATIVADAETLVALERRASALADRLRAARPACRDGAERSDR